jgi:flagellar biosynthesis component FlhA
VNGNVATVLVAVLVVIVAVVGGVVVIVHPDTLSFKQYVDALSKLAIGVGVLGVGRGLAARKPRT